jgi:hypothetical protein
MGHVFRELFHEKLRIYAEMSMNLYTAIAGIDNFSYIA